MTKVDDATQAFLAAVAERLQRLRDAGKVAVPSDELAAEAIRGCINSRTGVWRRSKPKGDNAALLWGLVKFHCSSGSLWGFPWFADAQTRDELDTLAIVLLGNRSRAADNWHRAVYG